MQGHANTLHLAKDALLAACQYVVALQQILSRCIDPLKTETINVGVLHSGKAPNVMTQEAFLSFNGRAFDLESMAVTRQKRFNIARGMEAITGCTFDVVYNEGYEPLVNDNAMTDFVRDVCEEQFGKDSWTDELSMTCDDFSYYMNATNTPGFYFTLLAGTETGEALRIITRNFLSEKKPCRWVPACLSPWL